MNEFEEELYKTTVRFTRKAIPELIGHYADNDDNDMQFLRDEILIAHNKALDARVKEVLERLKEELPTKFAPADENGYTAGGWHLQSYELAIDDFREDIDAELAKLEEKKS